MSAIFKAPKFPTPPEIDDEEIAKERRRRLAESQTGPRGGTVLTGGQGVTTPLLGRAAAITGAV